MKKIQVIVFILIGLLHYNPIMAQFGYWQQKADYQIEIDFDVNSHLYRGRQLITYSNESPDTLHKLYFHTYLNAFQPNSTMDLWAQEIPDPNYNLDLSLKYLTSSETGFMKVGQVLLKGKQCALTERESLLQVDLYEPILPGEKAEIQMSFLARPPVLVRRTGRDNAEGIDYTMAQWYPKLCVYDEEGWHATPFIGREFYSDWGDFDVKIKIDSTYVLAAGADTIEQDTIAGTNKKLWHFVSKNVLDFSWSADRDYRHHQVLTGDGTTLHFYFQEKENTNDRWLKMAEPLSQAFTMINEKYGPYPYDSYSIIQAGDGATEYSKSTFITGDRNLGSLVGVNIHEIMHSWFQHLLATQENRYAWMDEGFSSFAATEIKQEMRQKGIFFGEVLKDPFEKQYQDYVLLHKAGFEEPMSTPANFFKTNIAYQMASYSKGELFLNQLRYLTGKQNFDLGMKRYVQKWKFKHPRPKDFIRVMEEVSGLELDWYLYYWTHTTESIDYGLRLDSTKDSLSVLSIQRFGEIPMPLDVRITYPDGSDVEFIIPLDLMMGHKPLVDESNQVLLQAWPFSTRLYQIKLQTPITEIQSIVIDPQLQMADVNRGNNSWNP
jgi:hypothetical protein